MTVTVPPGGNRKPLSDRVSAALAKACAKEPGADLVLDDAVIAEIVDDRLFVLPATVAEADELLGALGQLATAVEWKRAALVFARVRVADSPGRPTQKVKTALLTPAQFAALGIHGLRSKNTVIRYWQVWQRAVEEGTAEPVKLGDRVQLPDVDWAEYFAHQDEVAPEESPSIPKNCDQAPEGKFHQPQPSVSDDHCLWGGSPPGAGPGVSLPLNTTSPEDRSEVAQPDEWTDEQRERMCASWKARLQLAARNMDKAVDRLVGVAHEAHPPGSAAGDAKTQATFAANIAAWTDTLASLELAAW